MGEKGVTSLFFDLPLDIPIKRLYNEIRKPIAE